MGRANNSFTNWVGDTFMEGERVTLPEKDLWVAVLTRAALDACQGAPRLNMKLQSNVTHQNKYTYDRDQARHFFLQGGSHFDLICELAGRNPVYVQQRVRKILLRKNGWNVDVPITSHYRQAPRKGRRRGRPRKNNGKTN
jgi:hypothetical protein|tara:strand:+ start:17 stop:436 length:420 start_codon:yes stop_codon:yes gene_type:complete